MIYRYRVTIRCRTCGRVTLQEVLSVNPDKKAMTFKQTNPLTGLSGMKSVQQLDCGHLQDLEGHPVKRVDSKAESEDTTTRRLRQAHYLEIQEALAAQGPYQERFHVRHACGHAVWWEWADVGTATSTYPCPWCGGQTGQQRPLSEQALDGGPGIGRIYQTRDVRGVGDPDQVLLRHLADDSCCQDVVPFEEG